MAGWGLLVVWMGVGWRRVRWSERMGSLDVEGVGKVRRRFGR